MATRPSLSDQANAIMTLLAALKLDVDPRQDDQSKANELVNAIKSLNDTLVALLRLPKLAQRLGKAADRTAAFADVEQLVTVDSGVALSTFFKQVGSAVVQAQQELDLEFERDLRAVQANPPEDRLTPVQYAIPTVHAEMKLGFSQVSSRGINLLVFNNSQQKQNYSESTISFDIVAAPAPPNAARIPPAPPPPGDAAGSSAPALGLPLERATGAKLQPRSAAPSPADEAGLILESNRLSRRTVPAETPAVAVGPAFPLRHEARSDALTALEEKLTAGDRRIVHAQAANVVIVPSSLAAGARQTLLYLCPGTKRGTTSAERAFRCYLADRTSAAALVLRALRRPDAVGSKNLARRGLIIPTSIGTKDRAALPDVIGGSGAVLMRLVESANKCKPACILHPDVDEQAERIESISSRLPDAIPPLAADESWAVFVDGAAGSSRVREYVVVRGISAPATHEWREVHVVGISPNPRRAARSGTPHIHIPDAATVTSWMRTERTKLDALVARLEPLLRRLSAIVDANR